MDEAKIVFIVTRTVFLFVNITLTYIFLTPARSRRFQIVIFISTAVASLFIRALLYRFGFGPLQVSYIVGFLYLLPCLLIFKESFQAKFFIFFMIYSLTQLVFLIFKYIDHFISPETPKIYVLTGLLLEAAALPLINRHLKSPVRDTIGIIKLHSISFTVFPVLSFLLLTCYALQKEYLFSDFITLSLSTIIIFFTYYLIANSISGTRQQKELEIISVTDSLTGIYNRRYMEKRIQKELDENDKNNLEFAIIIADIDFFKKINDIYGHDCGDYLLKSITEDIQKSIRANDTVARWGGEEFLILLPRTGIKAALPLTERIRKTIESRAYIYKTVNTPIKTSLTLGVSIVEAGDTLDMVLKRADMALYHGKRRSRNCVVSYDEINNN